MRRLEMDTTMSSRAPTPLFCLATTPTKCTAYRYAPGHHVRVSAAAVGTGRALLVGEWCLRCATVMAAPAQTGVYVVNVTDGTHKCTSLRCSAGTATPR